MIAVHGSILSNPSEAKDIDIIATPGTPTALIAGEVQHARYAHGWPKELPLDIQYSPIIPELPYVPANVLILQGLSFRKFSSPEEVPIRTQWDLAAWVRACDRSGRARQAAKHVLRMPSLDTRLVSKQDPRIVLVLSEHAPRFGTTYHGGGPAALRTAVKKCPLAWQWILSNLPLAARVFLVSLVRGENLRMLSGLRAFLAATPAASSQQVLLTTKGLCADYRKEPFLWDAFMPCEMALSIGQTQEVVWSDGTPCTLDLPFV